MGKYKKVGRGKYKGDTRTVSLKQIRARYYFAKHPKPENKRGKRFL